MLQINSVLSQSTLINTLSTDVAPKKSVYVEMDFVSHLESTSKGGFQLYLPRIVVGTGKKVEVGLNLAYTHSSTPNSIEIQPNIKYQYYANEKTGVAASAGTILYAPVTRRAGTNTFAMVYTNVSKQVKGKFGPRVTGGVYGLVNRFKNTGSKAGAMIGYEQPISSKVKLLGDWFSGKNRFGYVSAGFAITTSKKSALYLGYSVGNEGRKNNSLFVFYGVTF